MACSRTARSYNQNIHIYLYSYCHPRMFQSGAQVLPISGFPIEALGKDTYVKITLFLES
jgi:hypothetical protein